MNWEKYVFIMNGILHNKKGQRFEEQRVDVVFAPDIHMAEQFCYRRWEEIARQDGWEWVSIFRTIAQPVQNQNEIESLVDKFIDW